MPFRYRVCWYGIGSSGKASHNRPVRFRVDLKEWVESRQGRKRLVAQIKGFYRTSLVVQWLRICLPVQGIRVQSLVWQDPTCSGATMPVCRKH